MISNKLKISSKRLNKASKVKPVSRLIKDLDRVYSTYVRKTGASFAGIATCFTCGAKKPWQELQLGHFVSRMHKSLRFDLRNTKIQCVACNIFKHGAMDMFALKLTETYGPTILKELNAKKREIKRFTAQELSTLIEHYSSLL